MLLTLLPMVVAGGLLIALSFVFGIEAFKEPGTLAAALIDYPTLHVLADRELGAGTLLAGTDDLLGPLGSDQGFAALPQHYRLGILRTPPGAFLIAGVLLALGKWLLGKRTTETKE